MQVADRSLRAALITSPESPSSPVAVAEVAVLRHLDLVAPPELAEPVARPFFEHAQAGDHLRLPQLTHHDGPTLRAAIARVLSVDTAEGGNREAVLAEARMRRVLLALTHAHQEIQRRARPAV